jgi:hypothetical protein
LGNVFLIGGRGSGAVFLKVVITVSHVDTRATACKDSSFSCFVVIWMALLSQHLLFGLFAAGIANTIKAVGIKSWAPKIVLNPDLYVLMQAKSQVIKLHLTRHKKVLVSIIEGKLIAATKNKLPKEK